MKRSLTINLKNIGKRTLKVVEALEAAGIEVANWDHMRNWIHVRKTTPTEIMRVTREIRNEIGCTIGFREGLVG